MKEKIPLLVVCGPTASGKTALAVELAMRRGGEVVSGDSMQIYRELAIGTALPTEEEKRGVPHHLFSFVDPAERFSVADYTALAGETIAAIHSRGRLPIVAGGTGLYISSLVDNLTFTPMESDPALREELAAYAEKNGNHALWERLYAVDPALAATLHPNNRGRVIRALEVYRLTGIPMSEQQRRAREQPSPYAPHMLGLTFRDRERLYARIDARVDKMLASGLVKEAQTLMNKATATAAQAIGYKELFPYLRGEISLDEAAEAIKRETRRYAKRQMTWFRRDARIRWLFADEYDTLPALTDAAEGLLQGGTQP
jgi:tRNA dimethylallyltransferase